MLAEAVTSGLPAKALEAPQRKRPIIVTRRRLSEFKMLRKENDKMEI